MNDIVRDLLQAAVQRGVEVIVIAGGGDPELIRLFDWTDNQFWWGATSEYQRGGLKAKVTDLDGDRSKWWVERDGDVIASGRHETYERGYHFDVATQWAERVLIACGAEPDYELVDDDAATAERLAHLPKG